MSTDPMDTPTVHTLADGFYVREAVDTIGWIDMGGWALIIDALEEPGDESDVVASIESTLGETPVRCVLNTHTHFDHVCLNRAFQRRFGAEIVNQDVTPLGDDGRWFEGDARRALMKPMVGCHTPQDCIIWFPGDSILFVGDIFGWGLINLMGALTDASAAGIEATFAQVIDIAAETIHAGHAAALGRVLPPAPQHHPGRRRRGQGQRGDPRRDNRTRGHALLVAPARVEARRQRHQSPPGRPLRPADAVVVVRRRRHSRHERPR